MEEVINIDQFNVESSESDVECLVPHKYKTHPDNWLRAYVARFDFSRAKYTDKKRQDIIDPTTGIEPWIHILETYNKNLGVLVCGYVSEQPIPKQLDTFINAIQSSRRILELKDNWDDQGSLGYSEETWDRAVQFLKRNALWVWENYSIVLDIPEVLHGPDGSIDIHWKTKNYDLLINIPTDPNMPASFYGDDRKSLSIEGTLDTSTYNEGLLLWLRTKS